MQDPVTTKLQDLDNRFLEDILPEIPLWIKSPDHERVEYQIEALLVVCVCLLEYVVIT